MTDNEENSSKESWLKDPALWKRAAISFVTNGIYCLVSILLVCMLFMLALKSVVNEIFSSDAGGGVQTVLQCSSLALYAFVSCLTAYTRGKRRTRKPKASTEEFWQANGVATVIFLLPALALFSLTDPTQNRALYFIYMPYLSLARAFGITQISVIAIGAGLAGLQQLCYTFGRYLWRKKNT